MSLQAGSAGFEEPAICLCGLSYKSLGVELRELFAVPENELESLLGEVLACEGIREAVFLSTCNRVEVLASGVSGVLDSPEGREQLGSVFQKMSGVSQNKLSKMLYWLEGESAIRHLFRVSAGLDSMIVGEPQILGQLKSSYRSASDCGATSDVLNRLFHRAFNVGKHIRTNTDIGRNAVSVCYAAKELAGHIFGDLENARVMLIGAGEVGTLTLKHFRAAGAKNIYIADRTLEKAVKLADEFDAVALSLTNFKDLIGDCDIIIGAVQLPAAGHYLISEDDAREKLLKRRQRPYFFIDLGVPRVFSPELAGIANLYLYNIDSLEKIVRENLNARQLEIARADEMVIEEVDKFLAWLKSRSLDPAIKKVLHEARGHHYF